MLKHKYVFFNVHMKELVNAQNTANAIKINPLKNGFFLILFISQIGVFGVCTHFLNCLNCSSFQFL